MKLRKLGASDLMVSEISLGSWLTYGVGVERDKAAACVDRSFELGINFIDTANVYGRGAAESVLGELLKDRPRDSYVLATKLMGAMSETDKGLSRAQVLKRVLVPAALPSFFSGLQQAVPFAWIAAVAGELLFNVGAGLGNLMMTAETNARMDIIIVCTATIALLGIAMSQLVSFWSVYALRWRR